MECEHIGWFLDCQKRRIPELGMLVEAVFKSQDLCRSSQVSVHDSHCLTLEATHPPRNPLHIKIYPLPTLRHTVHIILLACQSGAHTNFNFRLIASHKRCIFFGSHPILPTQPIADEHFMFSRCAISNLTQA